VTNALSACLPLTSRRQVLAGIAATVACSPAFAQPTGSGIVLTAAPGKRRLRPEPAAETDVWCYNGETPGPLIRLKVGQPATIRLQNRLPQPTTLHFSGHRSVNAMDGVAGLTQPAVNPGEDFDYRFTPQDAGVFLDHPLVPPIQGGTSDQVERGLSGMMIVEERQWSAEIDRDIAVLLDDWRLTESSQIDPAFGLPARWIEKVRRAEASVAGYTVVDAPTVTTCEYESEKFAGYTAWLPMSTPLLPEAATTVTPRVPA
jgi:FtsP/CotA-like multicopper oxidase with cupredoxin domain